MHDIWNPWHGCVKCSEGCRNCYMYFLDRMRGQDGSNIYRTKTGFAYPLQKYRNGEYKVKSGELIRVCMTSDFFLEEADGWRDEAWEIMRRRSDVKFFLLTKRPQRVMDCLPKDWGKGWENIFFNVSCENQKRADERIPILLGLPFRHKGIMCAPLKSRMAFKSGMSYTGRKMEFHLTDSLGWEIAEEDLYVPHYGRNCEECGSRPICNGCSDCGKCGGAGG